MKIIRTLHLVHDYLIRDEEGSATGASRALDDVNMEIEAGSFVTIIGRNGSGKSTLARHLNALLMPTEGTVWVGQHSTAQEEHLLDIRRTAGMVFQNPDNQIIAGVVEEDVAFGPENIGVPSEEIWQRVADSLEKVGMTECRLDSPNRLSGGQKQRVAIAGILAMKPSCMILDEATAMLDPGGRASVLSAVHELNRKEGVTVILITHYMEEAADSDRVIVMDGGRVMMDGKPAEIFSDRDRLVDCHLDVPPVTALALTLSEEIPLPPGIIKREALTSALEKAFKAAGKTAGAISDHERDKAAGGLTSEKAEKAEAPLLSLSHVSYVYSKGTAYEKEALHDICLDLYKGSFTGLIGHTGSGKSTLIQQLDALLTPTSGTILWHGRDIQEKGFDRTGLRAKVGLVFQYPEYQLFEETVLKDVCFGPKNMGQSEEEARANAMEALRLTGIEEKDFEKSPFELSGGQKRRVAIAGVLAMQPEVLVLDEPAAGLDPQGKQEIIRMVQRLNREQKVTVIWTSHAMEDIALCADRLVVMHEGCIVRDGRPGDIFSETEYLASIGLAAPEMTYIVRDLRQRGILVPANLLTVDAAAAAVLALWRSGKADEEVPV